ncbi:hypothetical protein HDU76_011039, partial [Blyttiomyces sp. JEL0837]
MQQTSSQQLRQPYDHLDFKSIQSQWQSQHQFSNRESHDFREERPSHRVREQSPSRRDWIPHPDHNNNNTTATPDEPNSSSPSPELEVSVMSFNVLADSLAQRNPHLYKFCRGHGTLAWESRGPRIIDEILKWNSDVVCLQEVDHWAFSEISLMLAQRGGYQGHYLRRIGPQLNDGCAMFWKTSALTPVRIEDLEYNEAGRGNVAILGLFSSNSFAPKGIKTSVICVGTTHLLFNPKRGHIKMAQFQLLTQRAAALAGPSSSPVVICGDFNLIPNSYLFKYILSGETEPFLIDEFFMSGQNKGGPTSSHIDSMLTSRKQQRQKISVVQEDGSNSGKQTHKNSNEPYVPATMERAQALAASHRPVGGTQPAPVPSIIVHPDGLLTHPFSFREAVMTRCPKTQLPYITTCHDGATEMVD